MVVLFNNETDTIAVGPTADGGVNVYTRVYDGTQSPPTVTLTSPMGRQLKVTLDSTLDRPTQYQVLPGNVPGDAGAPLDAINLSYDAGRPAAISQGSRSAGVAYDGTTGFVDSVTDPVGTTSFNAYDGNGRVTQETLAGSRTVYSHYDANGNVNWLKMPKSSSSTDTTYQHAFTATPLDLLGTYTPPSVAGTGSTNYGYDLDGLATWMQEPNTSVNLTRDGAGRPSELQYSIANIGTFTTNFTYDENGRTKQVANDDVTLGYTFDGSRVTQEQYVFSSPSATRSVNYTYDSLARIQTRELDTTTGTAYTLGYDGDSVLASVTNQGQT